MRWFWIDCFTEFVSGSRATAVKNVSLAEDHLHEHFSGHPLMPNSLVIEGLWQTAGLLVAQFGDFESRIVLAKVNRARFREHAQPGQAFVYQALVQDISRDGGIVSCTTTLDGRPHGEAELFFVNLGEEYAGKSLFDPSEFLAMLKLLKLFEVGRNPDGSRLVVPANLEQAEAEYVSRSMSLS